MISCIDLSKPRKKIREKYDDIMLDYKLSYSKEQQENHKRIIKTICIMATIYIVKQILFEQEHVVKASGGGDLFQYNKGDFQFNDTWVNEYNRDFNNSADQFCKPINDSFNNDLAKIYREFDRVDKEILDMHVKGVDGYISKNISNLTSGEIRQIREVAKSGDINGAYSMLSEYRSNNINPTSPTADIGWNDMIKESIKGSYTNFLGWLRK